MTDMTPFAAPGAEPAPASSDRKKLIALGGALAAAVLGGGGYFLLSGGGGSSSATPPPLPAFPHSASHAPAMKAKPAAKTSVKVLPAVFKAPIGHDPFKPLYVPPASASTGSGQTTAAGSSSTPASSSGSSTATSSAPAASYNLTLVSVTKGKYGAYFFTFKVDGVKQTVIMNQVFGKNGEIRVLAPTTNGTTANGAAIQVGDADPVQVTVGHTITVQ